MARTLSRRSIANYIGDELLRGASTKSVASLLAAYLVETKRTKELHLIVHDIASHLSDKGFVTGTITSAHELSSETEAALTAFVKTKTGAAKLQLDHRIDNTVLGGVKVDLPGKELDATIARQLTILKTRYKKA